MAAFYSAYTLSIRSEISLPELLPLASAPDQPPDVVIRIGAVPQQLNGATTRGVLYEASPNQFLLNMHDIGRYLVQNGSEIVIEPSSSAVDSDIRVFLLGSCIGALLHQRGILAFHAATFATKHGAVMLTGPSGIGKSTLLGAMIQRGYPMLADDVTGVVLDDAGKPHVLPAFPRTKLWADAAKVLAHDVATLEPTRPGLQKYEMHLPEQFEATVQPAWRIYRLLSKNRDELSVTPISPLQNFRGVLFNTYRKQFLDGLAMQKSHFELVSAVARHVTMSRIVRPSAEYRLYELADLIEQDFSQ